MTEQKPTEEEIKEQRIRVARKTLEDKV